MEALAEPLIQASRNISEDGPIILSPFQKLCEDVDGWFLMQSPWPVIGIVMAYLAFVIKIGPDYMKDRKPLNIKPIILVYNLYQTFYNAFIVQVVFTTPGALTYVWRHGCHPIDPDTNPYLKVLNETAWYFFFSKIMDLLDTIFFILRKKNSHVTFLHVYHHANMVMVSWSYLKYIKGEQGAIVGSMNSFIHTIMYSYYFLSALGPEVQKYLWWKKYITRLQMLQFVIIIVYMLTLIIGRCDLPASFTYFMIFQGGSFFVLFANFYFKSYVVNDTKVISTIAAVDKESVKKVD